MKVFLIIFYPSIYKLLIKFRQCQESEKQREDAAHIGKNHENKSLMGPLKSLGAPGKYPLLPSQWAWLGRTILVVTLLGVVVWWSCIGAH